MSSDFCFDPNSLASAAALLANASSSANQSSDYYYYEYDYDPSEPQFCPTGGATFAEMVSYDRVSFWLETVVLPVVGLLGVLCNSVAIAILLSRRLANLFNRTLAVLAVLDTLYIACDLLESLRRSGPRTLAHTYAFPHLLYPLQNVAMVASIYTTVVVALERYIAVSRPIDTFVVGGGGESDGTAAAWRKVLLYVGPAIAFSVGFNIPTFFEFCVLSPKGGAVVHHNAVTITTLNGSTTPPPEPMVSLTVLRRNEDYIKYYINMARIPVTGLIPLVLLCLLNYLVLKQLIRRRKTMQSLTASFRHYSSQMTVENRQAHTLFGVAALFVAGHILRILLNLHEMFQEGWKESDDKDSAADLDLSHCALELPFWVLVAGSVSRLLITASSSANLLVYCVASGAFRRALCKKVKRTHSQSTIVDRRLSRTSTMICQLDPATSNRVKLAPSPNGTVISHNGTAAFIGGGGSARSSIVNGTALLQVKNVPRKVPSAGDISGLASSRV